MFGFCFILLFYLALYNFDSIENKFGQFFSIIIVSTLIIIGEQLYWMGMHSELGRNLSTKKKGSQIGAFFVFTTFATSVAPLIGAFVITTFSYNISFLVVIVLLIFAMVPIFFTKNVAFNEKISIRSLFSKTTRKENTLFFYEGINFVGLGFVWPVLMFLVKFSLVFIGSLIFIVNMVHGTAYYFSGKLRGSKKIRSFFRAGSYGTAISIFLRVIYLNPVGAFMFQGLGALSVPFMVVPLHEYF